MNVRAATLHDVAPRTVDRMTPLDGPGRGARSGTLYRQQVGHDIRHELSTIMLLASALNSSAELAPQSRARVGQILSEARWLEELIRAYDVDAESGPGSDCNIRVDLVAADILRPIRMSTAAAISLDANTVSARIDRLALWRVLRNVVCNALAAAGPHGRFAVAVYETQRHVVVTVDDDGPGFDPSRATPSSLGLTIVADLLRKNRAELEIGRGALGGCGVRLLLRRATDA